MPLYYQDDLVTLYHGDCLADHREWLDADVLVTDPPYGMAYVSNRAIGKRGSAIAGDGTTEVRDNVLTAWGAKPALSFGRWDIARPAGTKSRLVWDKNLMGTGDLSSPWGSSDEEIYVLGDWPAVKPGGRARDGGTPTRHHSVLRVQALAPGSGEPT